MKHAPAIALLLASALATTACSHPRSVAAGVGGTLAVASIATGVGTYSQVGSCGDADCEMDDLAVGLGTAFIAAGIALAYGSYLLASSDDPEEVPRGIAESPTAAAAPAPADTRAVLELPARSTDDETLRLARQASRAASMRQCAAARLTLRAVASRDPAYHADLVAMPSIEVCR